MANESMWWGYLHSNGEIRVKRFFGQRDIDETFNSPFVLRTTGPFPAVDREMALGTATSRLRNARIQDGWSGEPA